MAHWLLINGSPRINGKSTRVMQLFEMMCESRYPEVSLTTFEVARRIVGGCDGCDYCKGDEDCIIEDDMFDLYDALPTIDRLIIVTPIYFAGLPSQMKAVCDRLQPYYWKYEDRLRTGLPAPEKRPLTLYLIGDGGDPHGHDGAVVSIRAAFQLAGFKIEEVRELIGLKRIKPDNLLGETGTL